MHFPRSFHRRLSIALLALAVLVGQAAAQAPEYRAQWADAFNPGFLSSSQVTTMMSNLRAANSNVVIPEVRVYSDAYFIPRVAYYPALGGQATIVSNGIPITLDLNSEPEPRKNTSYDALAEVIRQAHGTTEPLEVWAWLVSFRTGATMRSRHPEWLTWDSAGNEIAEDFDPGHPGVQQQLVNICMDIVSNYDVDGLNFDYIRFINSAYGYNPVSVARFNAIHGRSGTPANTDEAWKQWRRDQVTSVMRKIYLNVIAVRPDVRISADTITWAPGPNRPSSSDPNPLATWKTNFQNQSSAYRSVYQDWRSWMEEGILDIAIPMNYFRECTHPLDYDKWSDFTRENQFNRQAMIGPGTYLNTLDSALDQLARTRQPSIPNGMLATGQAIYSYASPYAATCGGTIQKNPAGMAAALSGGTATRPTALYPTPAPLPSLPRLTNGKGHLMGTVTRLGASAPGWVDGAIVTLTGPVTRTMRSDGTGFYGFVDLPPGQYTLRVRAAGTEEVTGQVDVAAHAVSKQDVVVAPASTPDRLAFTVSPGEAMAGAAFEQHPVVSVLNAAGQTMTSFNGAVTLAVKPGTGTPGAALLGTTTVNAVNGVATFANVAVDQPGADYVLVATSGSLISGESEAFDVLRVPLETDTFRRAATLPNGTATGSAWGLSGLGVNRNPGSPYYGYVYLTDRSAGQNRVHILRPEPASAGTGADQYVDTGRFIQMDGTGLTPWDATVGPDDTVWIADLGAKRLHSAPPVPPGADTSVGPTLQVDLSAVSATGGPRGLAVTGPIQDARVYVAWFTDSRILASHVAAPSASETGVAQTIWASPLGLPSGPYGAAVDTAGNSYWPRNLALGSTDSAFLKAGPDGATQAFSAAIPAWAMAVSGTSLQDAAFVADARSPGGGYLYYSASVTVSGAAFVVVHRFGLDGAWLDGFGPAIPGAPSAYTPIEIPRSTTSTVAYMDADDRGNVYVLGMDGGSNAVIKVARKVTVVPFTMEDVASALRLGGGLNTAGPEDVPRLDVAAPDGLDLTDAVALARKVAGLEDNP